MGGGPPSPSGSGGSMEVRMDAQAQRRRLRAEQCIFVTLAEVAISPTRERAHVLANLRVKSVKSGPVLCFHAPCAERGGRLFRTRPTTRVFSRTRRAGSALDETDSGTYKRASVGPAVSFRAQTRFARRPDIAPPTSSRRGAISGHHPRQVTVGDICFADAAYGTHPGSELVFEMVRDAGAAH